MTHLKNNSTQLSRKEKMILGLIIVGFIAITVVFQVDTLKPLVWPVFCYIGAWHCS